jgi:hypothetical protein
MIATYASSLSLVRRLLAARLQIDDASLKETDRLDDLGLTPLAIALVVLQLHRDHLSRLRAPLRNDSWSHGSSAVRIAQRLRAYLRAALRQAEGGAVPWARTSRCRTSRRRSLCPPDLLGEAEALPGRGRAPRRRRASR